MLTFCVLIAVGWEWNQKVCTSGQGSFGAKTRLGVAQDGQIGFHNALAFAFQLWPKRSVSTRTP
jgi:hypothetical protein